jgi:hypothetical protein
VAWAARLAAEATRLIAEHEAPAWPGMIIDARLEPKAVVPADEGTTPASQRFALEIAKKAGEPFALRLVVRNFYEHAVHGNVRPRLPDGWTAEPDGGTFDLEPGAWKALDFRVMIPAEAEARTYEVGGQGWFSERERAVTEIHTVRVQVEK